MKYFFEEVTQITIIGPRLEELELNDKQKEYLMELAKSMAHHRVVDLILTELEEIHKESFLSDLSEAHHPELLSSLKGKIENLEHKIILKVKEVEEELLGLITE